MDAGFWHDRWQNDQLGWHQTEINATLAKHWPALGVAPDAGVFVPLCGKSLDMRWLRERGHPIVGVELSPIAVRDFFAEAEIEPTRRPHGDLETFEGGGYTLHQGDFFALTPADLRGVGGVFDRGSLVALPPEMRARYAAHLTTILPVGARVLLVTVAYAEGDMNGPPHSVPDAEVEARFADAFTLERIEHVGPQAPPERFLERGLKAMTESVWRLERRSDGS